MQLHKPFVLSSFFRTVPSAREEHHERILLLQLRKGPVRAVVVGQVVIRAQRTWNDVRSHRSTFLCRREDQHPADSTETVDRDSCRRGRRHQGFPCMRSLAVK